MNKYVKIAEKTIRDFFLLWKHYGLCYASYGFIWWFCFYLRPPFAFKLSTWAINRKTAWLDRYIERKYADIINRYKNNPPKEEPVGNMQIWVFWGQGEAQMPPLIKACYRQLNHFNDNVNLVTSENVANYIELPAVVYEKVKNGQISWAHFSDIIRNTLLAQFGGIWLDATVWVSGVLPWEQLRTMPIYTANGMVPKTANSVRFWTSFDWNWSTWCMSSNKRCQKLFSFVSEMLQAIAVKEKCWLDYVVQDYLVYYACRHFSSVQEAMESLTIQNPKRNQLASMMNDPFDENKYNELIKSDFVFKLSFRSSWREYTPDGMQTFYGRILSNLICF